MKSGGKMKYKLIYILNQYFPNAISTSMLSKELNLDLKRLELLINELLIDKWPVDYNNGELRLKTPMYTDIGIMEQVDPNIDLTLKCFRVIDSTNLYAKEHLSQLNNPTVLLAYEQTAGVGRLERTWDSPMGKSLSLTFVLKNLPHNLNIALMSQLSGAALVKTLNPYGSNVSLKWPNDVLINRLKVAGILCELEMNSAGELNLIIGVGVNLNQTSNEFDPSLRQKATSIQESFGKSINPDTLIASFINNFFNLFHHYTESKNSSSFMNICREYSVLLNEVVRATSSKNESRLIEVLDIQNDGGLLVKDLTTQSIETLISSEISLRHPDGYYI